MFFLFVLKFTSFILYSLYDFLWLRLSYLFVVSFFFQIVKSVEKIERRKSARKQKRKVCISCF